VKKNYGEFVDYTVTVKDDRGNPVSGATIGGSDSLRSLSFTTAPSVTDNSGRVVYRTTVPPDKTNGLYEISFVAAKADFQSSQSATRRVQVDAVWEKVPGPEYSGETTIPAVIYLIVHDPPGDRSYAWVQTRNSVQAVVRLSLEAEVGADISVGLEAGIAGVEVSRDVSMSARAETELIATFTTEETYKTSEGGDPSTIGPGKGDKVVYQPLTIRYQLYRKRDTSRADGYTYELRYVPVANRGAAVGIETLGALEARVPDVVTGRIKSSHFGSNQKQPP